MQTQIGTDIQRAGQILSEGGLVSIPTETVYGLAANALNEQAVHQIFNVKDRPLYNPLILHISDPEQLTRYVRELPAVARTLLNRFSPGPLTILLPKSARVPDLVTAGLDEVALRIPDHPLTLQLLRSLDYPLAAPSANPFGYISPTTAGHVEKMLGGKIPYILDGGPCTAGIESTIVGFRENKIVIFREGVITREDLEAVVGPVSLQHRESRPVAPGMIPHHYAPRTPLILTEDPEAALAQYDSKKIGLITFNRFSASLPESNQLLLFTQHNLHEAAKNLYAVLHEMDARNYELLIVQKLAGSGLAAAINDRLYRASMK